MRIAILFFILFSTVRINAQQTIRIKKKLEAYDRIYATIASKAGTQYLVFQSNGSIFQFTTALSQKEILKIYESDKWLNRNAARGTYEIEKDQLTIFPIVEGFDDSVQTGKISFAGNFSTNEVKIFLTYPIADTLTYHRLE